MKTISSQHIVHSLVAVALAGLGSSAFAAWSLDIVGSCGSSGFTTENCGAGTADAPAVTLSGWSTATGTGAAPTTGTTFAAANIYNYGAAGVGIVANAAGA